MANTHSRPHVMDLLSGCKLTWIVCIVVAHLLLPSVMSVWALAVVQVLGNLSVVHLMYCLFCKLICSVWCDYAGCKGDCEWLHGHNDVRSWATLSGMVTAIASPCQCRDRYLLFFIAYSSKTCSFTLRTDCKLKLWDSSTVWGTQWCSWLRHCTTSQKVTGLIPDGVIGFFHWHNPSGRTMALGSTQPLTVMCTRNVSWG
jgi:hypothetical protein